MKIGNEQILISGAGLVGCSLAIALKQIGYKVSLFEKNSDMRKGNAESGRSINLVLTAKGLKCFDQIKQTKEVLGLTCPVIGRMMHSKTGDLNFQAYGRDESEHNLSVSRAELNKHLLSAAEEAGVCIYFDEALENLNLKTQTADFNTKKQVPYTQFFGADGAGSVTRQELVKQGLLKEKIIPLGIDYKELLMPSILGKYPIEDKSLHIWPRETQMLMALPNQDGSFTMTLYMPPEDFKKLSNPQKIQESFEANYFDVIPLIPDYKEQFQRNPASYLGTLDCSPWIYKDQVCLIGDAAHAIVPFYGQGMNCGLSDVSFFIEHLKNFNGDWGRLFTLFNEVQGENARAVARLSIDNYKTMSKRVADEDYLLKRRVEEVLEKHFPESYRSVYGMVTYTLIPYSLVVEAAKIHDEIFEHLCYGLTSEDELDLERADNLIKENLLPFYAKHGLDITHYLKSMTRETITQ
jgi:kynurenine 3-monooxygenase